MRRILAVVVGLTLAVLAACSGDGAAPVSGVPVCRNDAACASGICDAFRGCVDCRASSQCQSGQVCLGGTCRVTQPCADDVSCSDGQLCDLGSQTCVDCKAGADCAVGSACVNGACQPASTCHDVHGCRPGTVCDLAQATCVECLGNGDCQAGARCVQQRCTRACAADSECGAGLQCDELLGLCLECAGDADCADSRHCSSGSCVLDTCVAGSGTCDATAPAVQLCSAAGDRTLPVYCGAAATCQGEPGHAKCSDWICTPGMSQCNAAGELETCAMDGLSTAAVACGAEQVCVGTRCLDIVCDPGTISCNAETNSLHSCSADGTVDSVTLCNAGQYCDVDAKDCLAKNCVPGTEACVGDAHGVCDELGSGYGSLKPCKASETCVNAACLPLVCDRSTQFCGDDGNVYYCDDTGTVAVLSQTCQAPGEDDGAGGSAADYLEHCEKHGGSASCFVDPCAKGQPYCDQNQLVVCNAQGTGPVGPGTACGADAVCVTADVAHCAPKVCEPSTRFCDVDGNVHLCGADGSFAVLWETCGQGLYCDPVDAYCKYETCTPSAAGCNGNVATTCKADGSTWEPTGTDCSLSNKLCDAGVCKLKICEPYSYFCSGGNVHYCGSLGTTSTVAATCLAAEYCSDGYPYCLADQCTGGKPVCVDSTHLATCKADGSGPNGAGTACGANKTCDAGVCKTQVCTPNSKFCQGGHVQACDSFGLSFSQDTYCFADQYCKTVSPTDASCETKVCSAGAKGCDGESYGTCDALGSGYTESPTSCTATSKVCSLGGCATSAVDVIGDQTTNAFSSGSYFMGDVVYVRTTRKLTQIELDSFSDLSGQSLHWAIYSSLTEGGPYAPVFDAFAPGTTAGFQSSGAIAVTLTAGRYYVIGMRAQSGMFVYRNDGLTPPLSFADQLGTMLEYADPGQLPPTFSEGTLGGSWHMRLTTTLP